MSNLRSALWLFPAIAMVLSVRAEQVPDAARRQSSIIPHTASTKASSYCDGPLSQRLVNAAIGAPKAAQNDGTLYGMQRWKQSTGRSYVGLKFPGLLSCAYTVSAIFKGACHPIGEISSVRGIDGALAKWQMIRDPRELKPGDVVFWKPVRGTILGLKCPGHWHVGISLGGDSTIDNDWWTGMPKKGRIARECTTFAYGRRPTS
jgi:hypothetical protein